MPRITRALSSIALLVLASFARAEPATLAGTWTIEGHETNGAAYTGTVVIRPTGAGTAEVVREVQGGAGLSAFRGEGRLEGGVLCVDFPEVVGIAGGILGPRPGSSRAAFAFYGLTSTGLYGCFVGPSCVASERTMAREQGVPFAAPATPPTGETPAATPTPATPTTPATETPTEDVRARIARIANRSRGLGWDGGPEDRRVAYATLLFPHDSPQNQRSFASSMSSCGLFAMSVLRDLGVQHACLSSPYASQIGQAIANILRVGRAQGAWVDTTTRAKLEAAADPLQGDMVLVGGTADWGGTEHMLVVVATEQLTLPSGETATVLVSVDGGQTGHSIQERRRVLDRTSNGQLWLRSVESPTSGGRRVQGYLSAGELDVE